MIDRREFLRRGMALGLAPAMLPLSAVGAPALGESVLEPKVRRRVTLGRTGLEMPDIAFGASRLSGDVALIHHALDRGITYFDTAEDYTDGASEETLGRALAGRRSEVVLTSKTVARASARRADLFTALEASLRRLKTEMIDIYMNHAVNDVRRVHNEEWFEFASRAKAQGKIRFTGMSGHGGRLVECLEEAIDADLVDVVLVAHNFGQDPEFYERFTGRFDFVAKQPDLPRVLRKARAKGIGAIAMKTLRGARLNDMRPYEGAGATFAQAAFRWVLSGGLVDALVVTMRSPEQIDEYLGASGWTGSHAADGGLLSRYARRTQASQCRYGCSDCVSACPRGIAIPDLLRARMYAEDYEAPALASAALASDGLSANACTGCDGSPCADACAHGVAIPELTHRLPGLVHG